MKNVVATILFISLIQGCSTLNPLKILNDKPSIEVSAQVAKNAEQEKSLIKLESGNTEQKADSISNDTAYQAEVFNQITNSLTALQLGIICLLAGWAIPDPIRCYSAFKYVVVDVFKGVSYPFKALANFILEVINGNKPTKGS